MVVGKAMWRLASDSWYDSSSSFRNRRCETRREGCNCVDDNEGQKSGTIEKLEILYRCMLPFWQEDEESAMFVCSCPILHANKIPCNHFLSPFLSFFFFFSLSFIFPFMAVHKTSLASQNFATETADAINQQIQVEQQAQHTYLACAAYFGRDDVALPVRFKLLATTRSF